MNDTIDKLIIASYTPPPLSIMTYKFSKSNNGMEKMQLASKQTISINPTERDTLLADNNIWLLSYLLDFYNNVNNIYDEQVGPVTDFSKTTDGYLLSEYFGGHEKFISPINYLRYMKQTNDNCVMNIYDGENSLGNFGMRPKVINEKVLLQENIHHDFPEYDFKAPETINYSVFTKTKYECKVFVECCYNAIPLLSINVPYQFYMDQYIPRNIFTWDIDKKQHCFAGKSPDEFDILMKDICENGIQRPIIMRISKGSISSVNDENMLILLIAKYLRLPSIPITLYISDEDVMVNKVTESLKNTGIGNHGIDMMLSNSANKLCKPYFIFTLYDKDSTNNNTFMVGRETFQSVQYIRNADTNITDHYLDTTVTVKTLPDPYENSDLEEVVKVEQARIFAEIDKSLDNEYKEVIQNITDSKFI